MKRDHEVFEEAADGLPTPASSAKKPRIASGLYQFSSSPPVAARTAPSEDVRPGPEIYEEFVAASFAFKGAIAFHKLFANRGSADFYAAKRGSCSERFQSAISSALDEVASYDENKQRFLVEMACSTEDLVDAGKTIENACRHLESLEPKPRSLLLLNSINSYPHVDAETRTKLFSHLDGAIHNGYLGAPHLAALLASQRDQKSEIGSPLSVLSQSLSRKINGTYETYFDGAEERSDPAKEEEILASVAAEERYENFCRASRQLQSKIRKGMNIKSQEYDRLLTHLGPLARNAIASTKFLNEDQQKGMILQLGKHAAKYSALMSIAALDCLEDFEKEPRSKLLTNVIELIPAASPAFQERAFAYLRIARERGYFEQKHRDDFAESHTCQQLEGRLASLELSVEPLASITRAKRELTAKPHADRATHPERKSESLGL